MDECSEAALSIWERMRPSSRVIYSMRSYPYRAAILCRVYGMDTDSYTILSNIDSHLVRWSKELRNPE